MMQRMRMPCKTLSFLRVPLCHSGPLPRARTQRKIACRFAAPDNWPVGPTATAENIPSLTEPERTIEAWLRVMFGTNELLYVD